MDFITAIIAVVDSITYVTFGYASMRRYALKLIVSADYTNKMSYKTINKITSKHINHNTLHYAMNQMDSI